MNAPYTKEDVVKGDYLLVSYQHDDKETVRDIVHYLYQKGIRLWYDEDLVMGEKWDEIVEQLIKHENCKGVVFCNSVSSFVSKAVYKERCLVEEKIKAWKKLGKTFLTIPVNIGKASTMLLLKAIFASLPDDRKAIEQAFPPEYLDSILNLFNNAVLYCYADPESGDSYKEDLFGSIAKAMPSLIDRERIAITNIEETVGTVSAKVTVGRCKGATAEDLPSYFLAKNQRVDHQGATYLIENGTAYQMKKIVWRPVSVTEETITLLAEVAVDVRYGGDDLEEWLQDEFRSYAFTEEEQKAITELRLLTEEDIDGSTNPDLLVFENADSHWWLDEYSTNVLQKAVKKDGTIYHQGYNAQKKRLGVRPVITVEKSFIASHKS